MRRFIIKFVELRKNRFKFFKISTFGIKFVKSLLKKIKILKNEQNFHLIEQNFLKMYKKFFNIT